jgi:hypothetical protein
MRATGVQLAMEKVVDSIGELTGDGDYGQGHAGGL